MTCAVLLVTLIAFLNYYNVNKTVTAEDKHYIQLYIPGVAEGSGAKLPYPEQVRLIAQVQRAVGERTHGWQGLPEGQPREPKQLYLEQTGLCYDRSRVLEKIYLYLGFETRHLSLFAREANIHSYTTVLLHHVASHAISEVRTRHGWLMVDSNYKWLSLDTTGEPVSMNQMQKFYLEGTPPQWSNSVVEDNVPFYNARCIAIYGLYSRHGRFYPPYTPFIPDFRLRGLLYNFDED
jgi:hypothetical protein